MRQAFQDVIEFEHLAGHPPTDGEPGIPDERTLSLRAQLLWEEFDELHTALVASNLPEITDGLADLIFVCLGTAIRFGIDLPAVWDAVAKANLAKFGPGSRRREDGKIEKPADWVHPNIGHLLETQAPLASIYPQSVYGGPILGTENRPHTKHDLTRDAIQATRNASVPERRPRINQGESSGGQSIPDRSWLGSLSESILGRLRGWVGR